MLEKKSVSVLDRIARDIAFEICLGGDRFTPEDISDVLSSYALSCTEMGLFNVRIRYHAEDFAPKEYRDEPFMSNQIGFWIGSIPVKDSFDVRPELAEMFNRCERGKWFLFDDGVYRRCDKAVKEAMWPKVDPERFVSGAVSSLVVARAKMDSLINSFGHETVSGCSLFDAMECVSYGLNNSGYEMHIMRDVNILADTPEKHSFIVHYNFPNGSLTTHSLNALSDKELQSVIDNLDGELYYRQQGLLFPEELVEPIVLPEKIFVTPPVESPDGYLRKFVPESIFVGPGGAALVGGHYDGLSTPVNFVLSDFSDKALSIIGKASEVACKQSLGQEAKASKSAKKKTVKSKGID